ncbi:MAG: hypothetical protein NTX72_04920 [Candidatus Uhrbacteria bacterium]|nr:hypothetical protein [Candidatus Uhrbacteria bacterium]
MAHVVHARTKKDGSLHFRMWTTVSDGYITEPMTREQIRDYLYQEAIEKSWPTTQPEGFLPHIDKVIERAIAEPESKNRRWEREHN